ncbi:MAG: hypothetical protein U9O53_06095 [archaeon]|nr:hypothetical protein [archaeon]
MDLTQKIELIEKDENSSLNDKIDLVLILAGEKPATKFLIADTYMDAYNKRRMKEVASLFAELEMLYEINDKFNHPMFIGFVYVGKYQENFDKIVNASTHQEYGICHGFPDTAIKACIDKSKRFNGSEIERIEQMGLDMPYEKLKPFMQFTKSDKYFEEEVLSTSVRWHDAIEKLSPHIYSQIKANSCICKAPYDPTFDDINSKIDFWYIPLITIYFTRHLVRAFH